MVGIALWHFAVLVPDRFWGGIIGAFMAASCVPANLEYATRSEATRSAARR